MKYLIKIPSRGSGNSGFKTAFDQGYDAAFDKLGKGIPYHNPYDQPGEEIEQADFTKGYDCGVDHWMQ